MTFMARTLGYSGAGGTSYWRNAFTLTGTTLSNSAYGFEYNVIAADSNYIYYVTIGTLTAGSGAYIPYIVKLDKTGNIVWQKQLGFSNVKQIQDAEIDSNGNLWLVTNNDYGNGAVIISPSGSILSSKDFITLVSSLNEMRLKSDGAGNMIVWTSWGLLKLNSSLNIVWSYRWPSGSGGFGKPALDSSGNIYVVYGFGGYGYLGKFNSSGVQLFGRQLNFAAYFTYLYDGGTDTLTVDSSGNIYIAGRATETDTLSGVSGVYNTYITLTKLDSSFNLQWSKAVKSNTKSPSPNTEYGAWYSPWTNSTLILPSGNILVSAFSMTLVFDSSGNLVFTTESGFADRKYSRAIYFDNSIVYASNVPGTGTNFGQAFVMKMPVNGSGIGTYAQTTAQWNYFDYSVGGKAVSSISSLPISDIGTTAYAYGGNTQLIVTPSVSTSTLTPNKTSITIATSSGSTAYVLPGTYTWIAPAGVTSASAVAIGGGGAGLGGSYGAGGGGALTYINGYSVTPGASYSLTVGAGGYACATCNPYYATSGGDSQVFGIAAGGGSVGSGATGGAGGVGAFGTGGGNGGAGGNGFCSYRGAGGGGAGGYTGNGGAGSSGGGGSGANGSGGGGGGGGIGIFTGCYSGSGGGLGGGVGFFGSGSSGLGGAPGYSGGSGSCGCTRGNICSGTGGVSFGSGGGSGGGCYSGCCYYAYTGRSGSGGAVRIIWGAGRSFPSTNTYTP